MEGGGFRCRRMQCILLLVPSNGFPSQQGYLFGMIHDLLDITCVLIPEFWECLEHVSIDINISHLYFKTIRIWVYSDYMNINGSDQHTDPCRPLWEWYG